MAKYLRRIQSDRRHGWPLFHDGDFDLSASVKAYFALKLAGDGPDAAHMVRARETILAHGGAARANVFTRITLALFEHVLWRAIPVIPIGIMSLPSWSPFNILKVSYWSRSVIAPLLILMSEKPCAANPDGIDISELFVTPPEEERRYMVNHTGAKLGYAFLALDMVLRRIEPLLPKRARRRIPASGYRTAQRPSPPDRHQAGQADRHPPAHRRHSRRPFRPPAETRCCAAVQITRLPRRPASRSPIPDGSRTTARPHRSAAYRDRNDADGRAREAAWSWQTAFGR